MATLLRSWRELLEKERADQASDIDWGNHNSLEDFLPILAKLFVFSGMPCMLWGPVGWLVERSLIFAWKHLGSHIIDGGRHQSAWFPFPALEL